MVCESDWALLCFLVPITEGATYSLLCFSDIVNMSIRHWSERASQWLWGCHRRCSHSDWWIRPVLVVPAHYIVFWGLAGTEKVAKWLMPRCVQFPPIFACLLDYLRRSPLLIGLRSQVGWGFHTTAFATLLAAGPIDCTRTGVCCQLLAYRWFACHEGSTWPLLCLNFLIICGSAEWTSLVRHLSHFEQVYPLFKQSVRALTTVLFLLGGRFNLASANAVLVEVKFDHTRFQSDVVHFFA